MEQVTLSRLITKLESGSREKGGSVNSGIISIGGTHLSNDGGFKWEKKEYISNSFFSKMRSGKIRKNDILIVKDGATTGKVSFVGDSFPYHEAAINEHVFRVEIDQSHANPRYVFHFLFSPKGQEQILNDFRGATVGGISRGFIEKVEVPLPDLETQDKIVAILDKAKTLIEKREQTIVLFDELLRSTFLDMFGDPIKNPKGWQIVELEDLGSWRTGGTPTRTNLNNFIGAIPWITSGELNNIFISETKEKISEEALKISNTKLIEKQSLLIGMYDTAALKSSINLIEATCNQAIAYAKINNEKANVIYLYYMIQIGKEHYKSTQRGVRQQNMNLSMIKKIKTNLPPIDLQIQFSEVVNKVNNIKSKIIASKYEIKNLLKGLSQSAFNGELDFNTAVDLEILMENDYDFFKKHADKKAIQLLLNKIDKNELNENKFYDRQLYDKAKSFVFELLKEDKIKQVFDKKTKGVKLTV